MNIKKVSKRQPLAQKYAIQKKVRAHNRKMRKSAHKNVGVIRKCVRERNAALSVPSSCPFKADILRTLQKRNEKRKQEKLDKLSARKQLKLAGAKQKPKPLAPLHPAELVTTDAVVDAAVDAVVDAAVDAVVDAAVDAVVSPGGYASLVADASSRGEEFAARNNGPTVETFESTDSGLTTITTRKTFQRPGAKDLVSITSVKKVQKGQAGRAARPTAPCFFATTSSQQKCDDDNNTSSSGRNAARNSRKQTVGARSSTSVFVKQLHQLTAESDVVVVVLDARDPLSCRSRELERHLCGKGKKVVLLLNKIDLVPTEAVKAWLVYLRRDHPTVAFKSASGTTCMRVAHNRTAAVAASTGLKHSSSQVLGASNLIQLIKNYARSSGGVTFSDEVEMREGGGGHKKDQEGEEEEEGEEHSSLARKTIKKASITVGIVGYPNVGKSSVINSLRRSPGSAATGAVCGVTRQLQYLSLDKQVRLIDSPGVVLSGADSDPTTILRNAVSLTAVKDPETVVEFLITRCGSCEQLQEHFKIPPFDTAHQFLAKVAHSRGKLLKGGAPDVVAAARVVITEWSSGKIPYFCMPPKDEDEFASSFIVNSSFLPDVAALDALLTEQQEEVLL
eukprot:GHVS01064104.1.p1 GENE.GHVS01064104.1~~GHVS01064104.1.p1  ORF type:complete len:619 (+),score=128.18 GHVS01064104.1:62-1918(+)